jgi:hypothetical protein
MRLGWATVWCGLAIVTGYGWLAMRASADRARAALAEEPACQRLVAEILSLQRRPRFAGLAAESPHAIAARAEEAVKQAGLPATALIRIEPQSPMRLGDSAYRLRPTRLELRHATLEQVTRFVFHMSREEEGATVRDLRLWAVEEPGGAGTGAGFWNAEPVLTQLIFSPIRR